MICNVDTKPQGSFLLTTYLQTAVSRNLANTRLSILLLCPGCDIYYTVPVPDPLSCCTVGGSGQYGARAGDVAQGEPEAC